MRRHEWFLGSLVTLAVLTTATGCGRDFEAPAAAASTTGIEGVRVSSPRDYTPSDRLLPPAADVVPLLSAQEAYDSLVRLGRVPAGTDPSGKPSEVLLGVFEHDDGGPSGVLSWGLMFPGVTVRSHGRPNLPSAKQNALVVVNASTGAVVIEIHGVRSAS